MDTRTLAERAHDLLDRAGAARAQGRAGACVEHLQDAADVLAGTELTTLHHKTCWRLAKAGYDFDQIDVMLDAVTPLLELGQPFAHVASARRALQPMATRWWDTRGYGDDRLARLWLAWAQAHRDDGDPWLEAQGHVQRAWHLACAGDVTALDATIERYLALDPRRFGSGPHRHPDAPDTPTSLWWAQLDLVRIGLWSCTWTGRRERARDLLDAMEDAAEAARLDRPDEPWFLDPVCRAAVAFDLPEVADAYLQDWVPAVQRVEHDRAGFHTALARGLCARAQGQPDRAAQHLQQAVELADAGGFGAEWCVDARHQLAELLHPTDPDRAATLRQQSATLGERFGIGWA